MKDGGVVRIFGSKGNEIKADGVKRGRKSYAQSGGARVQNGLDAKPGKTRLKSAVMDFNIGSIGLSFNRVGSSR